MRLFQFVLVKVLLGHSFHLSRLSRLILFHAEHYCSRALFVVFESCSAGKRYDSHVIDASSHTHTHSYTHSHTYTNANTYSGTHVYTRTHANTHTCTHMPTQTHTHTHASELLISILSVMCLTLCVVGRSVTSDIILFTSIAIYLISLISIFFPFSFSLFPSCNL